MAEERCAICWEPETSILPLLSVHQDQTHLFHIACLLEWMRTSESMTCALCRKCLSTTEKKTLGRLERRELLLELACKSNSVHIVRMLLQDHIGASTKESTLMFACTVSKNIEIIEILLAKINVTKVDWSDLMAEICLAGSMKTGNIIIAHLKKHEEQLKSLESTTDLILSNPGRSLEILLSWLSQAKENGIKPFTRESLLLAVRTGAFNIFKLIADSNGSLDEDAFQQAAKGHLEIFKYFCAKQFDPSVAWLDACLHAGSTGDMSIIDYIQSLMSEDAFSLLRASDNAEAVAQGFVTACQCNSSSLLPLWNMLSAESKESCLISFALTKAIQGSQFELVKDLLRLVPGKLSPKELSYPFILACQTDALVAVEAFLREKTLTSDTIYTGIQLCVEMGHAKLMRLLLLSSEIEINRNDDSLFKRCLACYGKAKSPAQKDDMSQIANLLISFGANIRVDNDLALAVFSTEGDLHLATRCLNAGADIHSRNHKAFTGAFERFHMWPAMQIYSKGVPLTTGDNVAFKKSVEVGDMAFLRYITELANLDITSNDHELFYMAIQSGRDHLLVAQYIWNKSNTKPPMKVEIVKTLVGDGMLDNLEFLAEKGWKIGEVPELLVLAAESNSVDMISYVLPFSTDEEYRKAVENISQLSFNAGFIRLMQDPRSIRLTATLEQCLVDAIKMGNSELAIFLLDGKLEGTDLQPLLHEAVGHGSITLVKTLVSRGAQTVHDPDLGPVMMNAIRKGYLEVVEYLHCLGIKPRKTQCAQCKCLVHAAIQSGDPEMLVLMLRMSKNVVFPEELDEDDLNEDMLLVINEIKTGIIEV